MRYVLMVLGAIVLTMGLLMFAKESTPLATLMIPLGGIFLAIGMAAIDIVEAIKRSSRS